MTSRFSVKSRLIGSASILAVALSAISFTASAQDNPGDDEIIVTGSRIPQDPNLVSSVPVQSLDDEAIRLSGEISLAEIVNDIPALVSSTSVENSVSGGSSLNLRGLDAERTLTLVNSRRHVAGFRGSAAVDVSSIPRALVERVEVTTGGASAIYGADAVTGVVNFILKDDFEGFEADIRGGISTHGDAENFTIDATYGKNFDNDRGNAVLSVSFVEDTSLTNADRSFSRDNNIAVDLANPALRLQASDLGADTPNFNGTRIGTLLGDIDTAGLTLTSAEQALLARVNGAPARIIARDPRVWLSSQTGSIAPGFGGRGTNYVDINNNGIADCQESRGGQVGFLAGCWITNPDGSVSVFEESLIADTSFRGVGNTDGSGSGGLFNFNRDTLYPETDSLSINLNSKYDLAPGLTAFMEAKYVNAESRTFGEQDSFYDTLFIAPDNPFIPAALQPVVAETGGLLLTQDPTDLSDNNPTITKRETVRFVGGLEWETESGHNFEVSFNHGQFKNTQDSTAVYLDRQFAATDAVRDPATGNIVCRSDLDPNAFYEIDYFTAGNGFADGGFASNRYYSFTPGDGQCQPLNPFGLNSVSPEAQDFVTADLTDEIKITQTVVSGIAAGEFDWFQGFLDGGIGYAAGVEYRRETSEDTKDPLRLGVLPAGTSFTPGVLSNTVDPFLNSFISIDNDQQFNTSGDYDVKEVFGEIRVPIFRDQPGFDELTLDAAVRYADYSTLGGQTTWKVGGTWAPYSDLSIRGTLSSAVRSPNVQELFDPQLPIQIGSDQDPCNPENIGLGTSNRQANCVTQLQAAGVPLAEILDGTNYIWENPLTGRFTGTSGGNPELDVETADSITVGAVFRPSFVDGFSLTVDYWDIDIENAIAAIGAGDLLEGCLDSADFPNVPFCAAIGRRVDGGLNRVDTVERNFARLEARGVDFSANYKFDWAENTLGARLVGSYQERNNRFFNPQDLSEVNPELREVQRPKLSGNLLLSWDRGPLSAGFQTTYQSKQSVDEIEDVIAGQFGDFGYFDETFIFDVNGSYEYNDQFTIYGGVNNIADKDPFSTQTAWPVGPRGRFVFLGVNYKM